MHRPICAAAASALLVLLLADAAAAAPPYSFKRIAAGFHSAVAIAAAPGDRTTLYVVEQEGRVETLRAGEGGPGSTFLDIRSEVLSEGEHGLLSIAFHPSFATSGLFYVDYTDLNGDTHVVEYRAENGAAVPSSARELLYVKQPYPNHKGGQLAFDSQGLLYVGMGDGGTNPNSGPTSVGDPENRAQSPDGMLGKLLRIDPRVPGATWQTVGYGLRNPWRFSFDRQTGDLWIGDVGAARFEEIDFRPAAQIGTPANYGWSRYEGHASYNQRLPIPTLGELVFPTYDYPHDAANCGVIGGYVYRGTRVRAARGRYFYGDLCTGIIRSFKVGPHGRASKPLVLRSPIVTISSFGEDAAGDLYAVNLYGSVFALR